MYRYRLQEIVEAAVRSKTVEFDRNLACSLQAREAAGDIGSASAKRLQALISVVLAELTARGHYIWLQVRAAASRIAVEDFGHQQLFDCFHREFHKQYQALASHTDRYVSPSADSSSAAHHAAHIQLVHAYEAFRDLIAAEAGAFRNSVRPVSTVTLGTFRTDRDE